ncbi:MAG TPA: MlaD family protein [Solirubrobacteraceae bacterium]|jgi:virulence factor Mce-like protein
MDRRRRSLAGSPLLIGAITTLIVVVAVFLSYNANNGLPFVPTYKLKLVLGETSGLQPSNQVKIGGSRVGVVSAIVAHQDPRTGRVTAIADLKLEKGVEPLPADTTATVLSVSAIGLKYLQLERGTSSRTLKAGATIPISQTREPVNIEDLFNMFDKKTRTANQENLNNFGDGVAGRGLGLNNTISTLRPLVKNAIPALRNLAAPQTGLHDLFVGLDRPAAQTAPVADANARFFSELDTFFTAFASVAPSLEQTIEGGPPALEQATHSLAFEAPFVEKSAEFMRLLRPSASTLRTVARPLGNAFAVGAVNLRAATALNTRLAAAAQAFRDFAQNPLVTLGLEDFTQTVQTGNPLLAGITPAQAKCNYLTLTFRNVASLFSENIGIGSLARAAPILAPSGPNSESFPAAAPANGLSGDHEATPSGAPGPMIDDNHLHVNPYPNVAGPGQPNVCEAGNEVYAKGKPVIGNASANTGTTSEATTREQDLFGQPYASATLKDLGTAPAKGKKK